MTHVLTVLIDIDERPRIPPKLLCYAVHRAIEHAIENDVAGTEGLDSRVGQVSVLYGQKLKTKE